MLGLLAVLALVALMGWMGGRALARFELDPAESVGVGGLIAVGILGWLTFVLFWLGLGSGAFLAPLALVIGIGLWLGRGRGPLRLQVKLLPLAAFAPFCLIACVNALAPPDTLEWDSLAYHLAVPKIWAAAGSPIYLPTQHHSNFPFAIDILYMPLLQLGESAAKGLSVGILVLGLVALFGWMRRLFGEASGWWAAIGFAAVPVVLWETGTAYIDVAHGLFAGMAFLYLGEIRTQPRWALIALLLGLACASKYTGLQAVVAASVVAAPVLFSTWRRSFPRLAVTMLIAVAIGSPWMVRNIANTGNPVYPFLYERFGGQGWDQWRADIYRNEQQTFGVGRTDAGRDWSRLPHAVLGLAYQPGRYINPMQTEGGGFPMGATGALLPLAAITFLATQRRRPEIGIPLAAVGVSLVMWFILSQQSRYMVPLLLPAAVCLGVLGAQGRLKHALAATAVLQAVYTGWLLYTANTQRQLPFVLGKMTRQEFYESYSSFANFAPEMDREVGSGTVALYDEVFGYFLNCKYVWANPGHSTMFADDAIRSAGEFVELLQSKGVTHVLIHTGYMGPAEREFLSNPMGFDQNQRDNWLANRERRWLVFLADAKQEGLLSPVVRRGRHELFRIQSAR